jgi:hypothetical protein
MKVNFLRSMHPFAAEGLFFFFLAAKDLKEHKEFFIF